MLEELEAKTAEAQKKNAELQIRVATVEQETRKIVDELIAEGESERKKIIEAAHRQADYIQQQARIAIQQKSRRRATASRMKWPNCPCPPPRTFCEKTCKLRIRSA